jgi:hypothetical protein
MSRTLLVAAVFLVVFLSALPSRAQQTPQPAPTAGCDFTFTAGGSKFLTYCINVNGNVSGLATPAGTFLIAPYIYIPEEGYGVCNESPATEYFDYGNGTALGWNNPTTVSQTTTSVKIARTTSDGIWTLTQTFTLDKTTPALKLSMALKNNSSIPRRAYLVRSTHVSALGSTEYADGSANSAFGWTSTTGQGDGGGLMLENVGPRWGYVNGFGLQVGAPNPCAFAYTWNGTISSVSTSAIVLAYVDNVGPGKTKTASMVYRAM